jgi:hypothetical protein
MMIIIVKTIPETYSLDAVALKPPTESSTLNITVPMWEIPQPSDGHHGQSQIQQAVPGPLRHY